MNFLKPITINNMYTKFTIPFSNLYLIKWFPKSITEIHDHDGKQCNFMALNGSLHECRFKYKSIGGLTSSQSINPLKIYSICDKEGYHQIYNLDNKIKWSLHRYK